MVEHPEWVSKSKRGQREEEMAMVEEAVRYGNGKRKGERIGMDSGNGEGAKGSEAQGGDGGREGGERSTWEEEVEAWVEGLAVGGEQGGREHDGRGGRGGHLRL